MAKKKKLSVSGISGLINKKAMQEHTAKQKKKLDVLEKDIDQMLEDFSGKIVSPALCALACHLASAKALLKSERKQLLKY